MKQRLWIVSELFAPDAQATSQILTTVAEGLASDFDVQVVCAYPTMQFDRTYAVAAKEERNGVRIRRFRATRLGKASVFKRVINLLTISIPIFVFLLRALRRHDLILVVTNPPVMPFVATGAAVVRGARVIMLTHDVYPDVLVPAGLLSANGLIYKIFQGANRWLLRRVQGVIVLGRDMQKALRPYLPATGVDVEVIPNWSEPQRIVPTPRDTNPVLRRLGLEGKFVIQYAGTMGRTHGIEILIECVRRRSGDESLHFLFSGHGVKRPLLERAIAENGWPNATLSLFVEPGGQNDLLNACDIAVISMLPGMVGLSVPSRMYNIMAAGKPLIGVTEPDSELALVITEERIGWTVRPGDVDGLLAAIDAARANRSELAEMGRRARRIAETIYTPGQAIQHFRSFLTEAARI